MVCLHLVWAEAPLTNRIVTQLNIKYILKSRKNLQTHTSEHTFILQTVKVQKELFSLLHWFITSKATATVVFYLDMEFKLLQQLYLTGFLEATLNPGTMLFCPSCKGK